MKKIRLSKTQGSVLFAVLISICMTAVMSFGISLIREGLHSGFFAKWFHDFTIGCLLSIPTGFTVVPVIKKWVDSITE